MKPLLTGYLLMRTEENLNVPGFLKYIKEFSA